VWRGNVGNVVPRLNRTSVGLKPLSNLRPSSIEWPGLNRTSVGLKHIERAILLLLLLGGLNRTSVGLKHAWVEFLSKFGFRPQSNQRGIETAGDRKPKRGAAPGLNRTSVGLKQNLWALSCAAR